jgi:hypothetical protein
VTLDDTPAFAWTMTWCFATTSFLTVSGVAATRVSPDRVSAGMPILMPTSWLFCWHDLTRLYKKETTVLFSVFLLIVKEIHRDSCEKMLLCGMPSAKSGSSR